MNEGYISEYAVFGKTAHLLRENEPQKTLCGKNAYIAMRRREEPICRLCKRIAGKIDSNIDVN